MSGKFRAGRFIFIFIFLNISNRFALLPASSSGREHLGSLRDAREGVHVHEGSFPGLLKPGCSCLLFGSQLCRMPLPKLPCP